MIKEGKFLSDLIAWGERITTSTEVILSGI